jgi:hypothetical protein
MACILFPSDKKLMKIIGTTLLLLGLLFTLIAAFQIVTKSFLDMDAQLISNPDIVSIYWSPITAIALVLAGVMALVIARKERSIRHH